MVFLSRNAFCSIASSVVIGSLSKSIASEPCCVKGEIIVVKRASSVALTRMGESETRNDADVAANDANPRRTGV